MTKIDLEQMTKDLQPTECYKQLITIESFLKKMGEINSNFTMNKSELVKRMSFVLVDELKKPSSKEASGCESYFNGLQNIINNKKELIYQVRSSIDQMEREIILQEELLGNYKQIYKNR